MKKDEERTVLITGAAEGMGVAYARFFAERGYSMILVSNNAEKANALADLLRSQYDLTVSVFNYDLSQSQALSSLLLEVECHKIDFLVNNAAEEFSNSKEHFSGSDRKRLVELQINSTVSLSLHMLRYLITENKGGIINVAAAPSKIFNLQSSFCQSSCRMFLCQFTESILTSLSGTDVCVQAVCPGSYREVGYDEYGNKNKLSKNQICSEEIVNIAMSDMEQGMYASFPGCKRSLFGKYRQEANISNQKWVKIS